MANRIDAAGDPWGMPVSTGLTSLVLLSSTSFTFQSDMKPPVHPIRSDSISSASMRLPKFALLTLLNADLASMNSAPLLCPRPPRAVHQYGYCIDAGPPLAKSILAVGQATLALQVVGS